jgi:hypothetical protein
MKRAMVLVPFVLMGCPHEGPVEIHGSGATDQPIHVQHDVRGAPWLTGGTGDPLPIRLTTVEDQTRWTLTAGDNSSLHVIPRSGPEVVLTLHPIEAQYLDRARVLHVNEGPEGPTRRVHYFVDPVRFWAEPAQ